MITSPSSSAPFTLKTILITGANGQLGRALSARFNELARQSESLQSAVPLSGALQNRGRGSSPKPSDTRFKVISLDRSQLDLSKPESIAQLVDQLKPSIIINAAAHTAVDQAELEPAVAEAINAVGPAMLAEAAKAVGATLIHYSTDYVFEGTGQNAYRENDACAPQSIYGASKLAGEKAIEKIGGQYFIFRTSWVYAAHGANFMLTMLKLAKDRDTLSVIDDQWGAPTWVNRIVAVTEHAVMKTLAGTSVPSSGIYHLCPRGETTWYRYAAKIFELHPDPERKLKTLLPISSAQYETNMRAGNPNRIVAKRPNNSRLNCEKLEHSFELELPTWEEDLRLCLSEGKL
jgi:dTDP-4-dehydrorhamnose reductase